MADESFWDLLEEAARLQEALGGDLIAWAQVYDAAGRAVQRNAATAAQMAALGRRGERFLQDGPPAAAQQALQLFFNPLQAMLGAAGGTAPGPLGRLWEAWAAATPGGAAGSDQKESGNGAQP